jgi:hypothetical protein
MPTAEEKEWLKKQKEKHKKEDEEARKTLRARREQREAEKRVVRDKSRFDAQGGRRRTRRRTSKTIRMKKSAYLREHHHLFRVLQNPTRRALNAELRDQKRELARRGLKE